MEIYHDREQAGRQLGEQLSRYRGRDDVIVLALPRGGVPVAFEIARTLEAPMDILLVRKLGLPGNEELAMGAIATGGARVINQDVVNLLDVASEVIEAVAKREHQELLRRERLYRGGRPAPVLHKRIVILADDGLATGSTMRAAVAAVRQENPARIIVAVPVGADSVIEEFRREVDEVVCPLTPENFYAVSFWYENFSQTTDAEVRDLFDRVRHQSHVEKREPAPHPPFHR